jgi:membrane-associated phospholipid phosphatase
MTTGQLCRTGLAAPVAAAGVAVGGFTVLAVSVHQQSGLTAVDPNVAQDVVEHRTTVLTHAAHVLSVVGSEAVVSALALLLVIALLERRGARYAGLAAVTMTASAFLTVTIKLAFGRPRPGAADRLGALDTSYSFPSGHTLNSAVLLGLFCLLFLPLARRSVRRVGVAASVLLAAGIGASRVYLGYHWTTDIIASWLVAAVLLAAAHAASILIMDRSQSGGSQVTATRIDT